jgi:uncharacterized protein YodC (DUF2158 family)
MMNLKPGDVVVLKSGGHPVTVAEVNGDTVECLWMGGEGDLFRETLPLVVLELATVEEPDDEDEESEDDEQDEEDEDQHNKAARKKGSVA